MRQITLSHGSCIGGPRPDAYPFSICCRPPLSLALPMPSPVWPQNLRPDRQPFRMPVWKTDRFSYDVRSDQKTTSIRPGTLSNVCTRTCNPITGHPSIGSVLVIRLTGSDGLSSPESKDTYR
jgi:hypothetical protein